MTDNRGEVVARYEPVFFEWQLSANDEGRYVLYTDHQSLLLAAREDHAKQSEYLCQKILEANIRAERAEAELAECRRGAERYRFLADRFIAADFNWGEFSETVVIIGMPKYTTFSCSLDATVDSAIDACVGGEG